MHKFSTLNTGRINYHEFNEILGKKNKLDLEK